MTKETNKTLTQGSVSERIMFFLAEVGECSVEAIYMALSDVSKGVIANAITSLKNRNFIKVLNSGKDSIKTVRVKARCGLPFLTQYDDIYQKYMLMSTNHTFSSTSLKSKSVSSTIRRHRVALSTAFMKSSNIVTGYECLPLSLEKQTDVLDIQQDSFYSSIDLKNLDVSQKHKIEFTRFVGCLFSENTAYIVYNLDSSASKWSEQGEQKTKWFIQDVIKYNSSNSNWRIASIVLFSKDQILLDSIEEKSKRPEFLSFFNVFRNVYAIPLNDNGKKILQSILPINGQLDLKYKVFGKQLIQESQNKIDCDCDIIEDNVRGLSFLNANVARLKRMKAFMELPSSSSLIFNYYCYDFQLDFLFNFFVDFPNINIYQVDL